MAICVSAIAAMSRNGVIGKGNKIPWHISEDFKYFKRMTMGKPIVMGRKTFESFEKPLAGRPHIVISRTPHANRIADNVFFVLSLEEALEKAEKIAEAANGDEIFVIGGAQIYRQAIQFIHKIYLTEIDADYEGDAFFPELDLKEWRILSEDFRQAHPSYSFIIMERHQN